VMFLPIVFTGPCILKRTCTAFLVVFLSLNISGCGVSSIVRPQSSNGSLVLADSGTAGHFRLAVANGALTLTEVDGSVALSNPALIDDVTGAKYSLAVSNRALMLVPAPGAASAATKVGFSDTVTNKTYALAVDRGALTLISN
jgi:hypothetical protein